MSMLAEKIETSKSENVFTVLDGASINGLLEKFYQWQPARVCLFRGKLSADMAEVAPYLVRLDRQHAFTEWVLKNYQGKHWGIFFASSLDERKLRRKYRDMLNALLPDGRTVMFRFYDPRIMHTYLPSCEKEELETLFEMADSYYVEDEDRGKLCQYRLQQGVLTSQDCD